MGLPILNMDGYLLKRIKKNTADLTQETADRTAADTALQQQLDNLGGGIIGQEVPTIAGGYQIIDPQHNSEKWSYWIGQFHSSDGRIPLNRETANGTRRCYTSVVSRELAFSNASIPLPFSSIFNGGKPYLAVIAAQCTVTFNYSGGNERPMRMAGIGFQPNATSTQETKLEAYKPFAPQDIRYATETYDYGVGRVDAMGFTRPILVDRDGVYLGYNFFVDAIMYSNGQTLNDITMASYNVGSQDYVNNTLQLGMIAKFSD